MPSSSLEAGRNPKWLHPAGVHSAQALPLRYAEIRVEGAFPHYSDRHWPHSAGKVRQGDKLRARGAGDLFLASRPAPPPGSGSGRPRTPLHPQERQPSGWACSVQTAASPTSPRASHLLRSAKETTKFYQPTPQGNADGLSSPSQALIQDFCPPSSFLLSVSSTAPPNQSALTPAPAGAQPYAHAGAHTCTRVRTDLRH